MNAHKPLTVGIDIGGTFTDFIAVDELSGSITAWKCLTTPEDPSTGLFNGLHELLIKLDRTVEQISKIVHGTTIASNTIIERKGAKTCFITTKGFRDLLFMRREDRYDMYDLQIRFSEPLVPRYLCVEVTERVGYDGKILLSLDPQEVRGKIEDLVKGHGIESIAVCFLHSYTNPAHELLVREIVRKSFPEIYVSISSAVPMIKEYERASTTVVDAYVKPVIARYLEGIRKRLNQKGFSGSFYMMNCSGGVIESDTAQTFPVRLLESGPVAGVLSSRYIGKRTGYEDILSFDMGGTTAKGCFIVKGVAEKTDQFEVARVHQYKAGSGIPIRSPGLKLIEIGGGGGSIIWIDERGVLQVGPQSSGSNPGPACYGRGGKYPTITDADLILGYLDQNYFLGGHVALYPKKSIEAFKDLSKGLNINVNQAAWGAHEAVNENIASAFRLHGAERGVDYTKFILTAFGGAGPVHACGVAKKMGIDTVIFPFRAGVLSAYGLLTTPLSFDYVQTRVCTPEELGFEQYSEIFKLMARQGGVILERAGISQKEIRISRSVDMRYMGQGWEIEIPLRSSLDKITLKQEFNGLRELFEETYLNLYTVNMPSTPVEFVTFKMTVSGPEPKINLHSREKVAHRENAIKGNRAIFLEEYEDYQICPVYDRYSLMQGARIDGPAVIEEVESTSIITRGSQARVDKLLNLIVSL